MGTRHINPEGLHRNPAFSQAVVVEQPAKTIYIGGQNGVDADGKVVGPTVGEQASQALRNLATILESEGASLANIVHWSIAVVDGHALDEGVAAFQQVWNPADPPPAITVHVVAGLGPGFLVEIDAVAVLFDASRAVIIEARRSSGYFQSGAGPPVRDAHDRLQVGQDERPVPVAQPERGAGPGALAAELELVQVHGELGRGLAEQRRDVRGRALFETEQLVRRASPAGSTARSPGSRTWTRSFP